MKHLGIDVQFELKNIKKLVFLDGEISQKDKQSCFHYQAPKSTAIIIINTCFHYSIYIYCR